MDEHRPALREWQAAGERTPYMSCFLVTGASSGIGAATALRLDADGHHVFAGVEDVADTATLAGASGAFASSSST